MSAICPQCGARADVDPCCVIEEPVYRRLTLDGRPTGVRLRLAAALLCPVCEYCGELAGEEARATTEPS